MEGRKINRTKVMSKVYTVMTTQCTGKQERAGHSDRPGLRSRPSCRGKDTDTGSAAGSSRRALRAEDAHRLL